MQHPFATQVIDNGHVHGSSPCSGSNKYLRHRSTRRHKKTKDSAETIQIQFRRCKLPPTLRSRDRWDLHSLGGDTERYSGTGGWLRHVSIVDSAAASTRRVTLLWTTATS